MDDRSPDPGRPVGGGRPAPKATAAEPRPEAVAERLRSLRAALGERAHADAVRAALRAVGAAALREAERRARRLRPRAPTMEDENAES